LVELSWKSFNTHTLGIFAGEQPQAGNPVNPGSDKGHMHQIFLPYPAMKKAFQSNIEKAIAEFKAGKILLVADSENRESEGDFVCAASLCTEKHINFMVTHGRGLVCAPIAQERAEQLDLQMMAQRNTSRFETAFTVSVEAKHGTTTGISAAERALTCRTLADASKRAADFICPGHIFPLKARKGGCLEREGHTEAVIKK
jgi:3,4-dihydroxy 2-butanone 4-phosphate synthase/GTP cyclohydrolase II